MLKARYEVESAKLEASKQEIVSKIEGEEAKLKLADAEQKLREAETKQKSDQALNKATIESTEQASKKAKFDVQRAERGLDADGRARAVGGNHQPAASTGLVPDMTPRTVRGIGPGRERRLQNLPDATTLRISARVDETERGRLAPKQPVTVQLNAIPDRQFTGHIEQIGAIASMDFSSGWPITRNFILEIVLDQTDPRFKPGISGQVTVIVDRVPERHHHSGAGNVSEIGTERGIRLARERSSRSASSRSRRRSGDKILIAKGVSAGEQVALRDPTTKE